MPRITGTHYDMIAEILAFRAMSGAWRLRDAAAILAPNLTSYSIGLLLIG